MDKQERSKSKEISTLLALIFGGVFFALATAVVLVYFYGPSGLYSVKQALLPPEMVKELKYQDVSPETGAAQIFVFDSMTYTYFHPEDNQWKSVVVDLEKYQKFYDLVSADESISKEPSFVTDRFLSGYPAKLEIIARTQGKDGQPSSIFQEVSFAYKGDFYRIELREEIKQKNWAYFHHKDIYHSALEILK